MKIAVGTAMWFLGRSIVVSASRNQLILKREINCEE
jgi:hypothetical protein